jgi:hypothetical protein
MKAAVLFAGTVGLVSAGRPSDIINPVSVDISGV